MSAWYVDAGPGEAAEAVDAYAVLGVRPDATAASALFEERVPGTVVAGLPPRVVRLPRSRLLSALIC